VHLKRKSASIQYQALTTVQYNTYHCVFPLFNSFLSHGRNFVNSVDISFPASSPAAGHHPTKQDTSQPLVHSHCPSVWFLSPGSCKGCLNSAWYWHIS